MNLYSFFYNSVLNYYHHLYLDFQLYNFMNYSALYSLLPSLFDLFDHIPSNKIWNSIMKYCWKECLDCFRKDSQPLVFKRIFIKEYLEKDETTTKYAFGILD